MRKLQCVVLLLALFLVAQPICAEQITLRVSTWLASTQEGEMYQRWADKYTESHPNIKVQFEPTDFAKILTAAVAGVAPDIFRVSRNSFAEMAEQNLLKPISDQWMSEINANDLFPAIRAQGTYKGRLYGWDPHIGVLLIHYNKTAFDNSGVAYPNNTWTWDTAAVSAKKLTVRNSDNTVKQWGFNINSSPSQMWLINTWSRGGDMFGPDLKTLFPSEPATKALNYFKQLISESRVSPDTNLASAKTYTAGQAAMIVEGTWNTVQFSALTEIQDATAVMPRDVQRATSANLHLWAMSSNSKYPKETWELFKSWVGLQNSLEFTDYGGPKAQGLPVWRQALRDPRFKISEALKPAFEMMDVARPLPFNLGIGPWMSATDKTLRQVFFEGKPILQAQEELVQQAKVSFEAAGAFK